MKTIRVIPAPGLKIRLPDAPERHLDATGGEVVASPFWSRRLIEGDVTLANPSKAGKGGK